MRSWLPVPGTTSGRLIESALDLFGAQGFAAVGVGAIADRAGVTTGSLYHHFASKEGLYRLVRADVERRVLDRLEGAAAARPVRSVADLAPVLVVGFDYLARSGSARLLAEQPPETSHEEGSPDRFELLIGGWLDSADAPLPALIAASWRAALWHASAGSNESSEARAALVQLLTGVASAPS